MKAKKISTIRSLFAAFGILFAFLGSFFTYSPAVFADEQNSSNSDNSSLVEAETNQLINESPDQATDNQPAENGNPNNTTSEQTTTIASTSENACKSELGALGWLVCPTTGVIAKAVDWLYDQIEEILVINPLVADDSSPIYLIWKYFLGITNIVFIIYLLVIVYSQLTGRGINNYGVKKALPKLIVAVILVNLSFFICSLCVDVSNIIGTSLRGVFTAAENAALAATSSTEVVDAATMSALYSSLASGSAIAIGVGVVAFETGAIWLLIPVVLGALVAVVSGLITIAIRQAVVIALVIIAPLAIATMIFPNTENLFKKWKNLFVQMLVFYPMFSVLFGASSLAGWAIILGAQGNGFAIILGVAVQIFPLFYCWKLMKMSGTFLGSINAKIRSLAAKPLATNRAWAEAKRAETRLRFLRNNETPSARLMNYMNYRKGLRDAEMKMLSEEYQSNMDERIKNKLSSYKGRDANGKDVFEENPNKYTKTAKRAELARMRASIADQRFKNTMSSYGTSVFRSQKNSDLALESTELLETATTQEFLTLNNRQADEDHLLATFLNAQAHHEDNPTEYNRLISNAAGDIGLKGEASIMGQMISKNAATEARRKREAEIMKNKFGYDRAQFHSATSGVLRNANGYAIDRNGNVIEDESFRLLPGKEYVKYDKYEIDPITGQKVSYFDMTDDQGQVVQRIYSNENGYMKVLLADDIMIGDPVNRWYEQNVGLNGILRKYYSTIASNITCWKDHSGGSTPMLAAMMRHGTLNSPGKHSLGYLQSVKAASKASAFLTNDKFIINDMARIFIAANPEIFCTADGKFTAEGAKYAGVKPDTDWVPFEYYIPDHDIDEYLDVNMSQLGGLRKDENGKWRKIAANDASLTLDDKKNFVKHDLIPGTMKKVFGMTNRRMSPNIVENQKPPTAEALANMVDVLGAVGCFDPSIFDTTDPDSIRKLANDAKLRAQEFRRQATQNQSQPSGRTEHIRRQYNNKRFQDDQQDGSYLSAQIREILDQDADSETVSSVLSDFIDNHDIDTDLCSLIHESLDRHRDTSTINSQEDVARHFADFDVEDTQRLEQIREEINRLLDDFES